jgi:hypothetical protein
LRQLHKGLGAPDIELSPDSPVRAGIGGSDGGNWTGVTPDGTRLLAGGDVANVFRIENQRDYRDYALLAYDLGE